MSSRTKVVIIGALVGAVLGAAAGLAYARMQSGGRTFGSGRALRLRGGAPDFFRIGMSLLAIVRQVAGLFKPAGPA